MVQLLNGLSNKWYFCKIFNGPIFKLVYLSDLKSSAHVLNLPPVPVDC